MGGVSYILDQLSHPNLNTGNKRYAVWEPEPKMASCRCNTYADIGYSCCYCRPLEQTG